MPQNIAVHKRYQDITHKAEGTAEFASEIAKSLNFTAEHTESAKHKRIVDILLTQINADRR